MARKRRKHGPVSKRVTSRLSVAQGRKLKPLEGGLITRRPLPDGRMLVTIIDASGQERTSIEHERSHGHDV